MASSTCSLVTYNPPCVSVSASLAEALVMLRDLEQSALPVIEGNRRFRGLLTLDQVLPWLFQQTSSQLPGLLVSNAPLTEATLHSAYESPWPPLADMLKNRLCLAVVGEDQKLDGVINRTEFLRELSLQSHPAVTAPVVENVLPAGEWVEATTDVGRVLTQVADEPGAVVAIAQGGLPLGAARRQDLAIRRGLAQAEQLLGLNQRTKVTLIHALTTCPHLLPGQTLAEAAGMMADSGARVLLVVNKAGRTLGLITDDLLLQKMLSIRHSV